MTSIDQGDALRLRTGEHIPVSALEFSTSRSGGPGGQNVNKVETRVEVRVQVVESPWLRETTQARIAERLASRIDSEGKLRVVSSSERTQLGNKKRVIERLLLLLDQALERQTPRIATRPTRGSKERRREAKRNLSQRKTDRRWRPE
jgi:ribosome-associated protein